MTVMAPSFPFEGSVPGGTDSFAKRRWRETSAPMSAIPCARAVGGEIWWKPCGAC